MHVSALRTAALKDLHIIERTPDPIDLLASDDTVLGQMNREQLEAIVRRFRVCISPSFPLSFPLPSSQAFSPPPYCRPTNQSITQR